MNTHPKKRSDFIGRRKAKAFRPRQKELYETLFPQLRLDVTTPPPESLTSLFTNVDHVVLEVGFGGGEHLIHRATEQPHTGFIGVEPFQNGLVSALGQIDEGGLTNIRLHDDDAGALLDWLPKSSLARIVLLYPDPWPKFKHWKRRFVSKRNLDRMARALQPGGQFLFASDIEHYVGWTLEMCFQHPAFAWTAKGPGDWRCPSGCFADWPGTRYEQKAIQEGRLPTYLTFERSA